MNNEGIIMTGDETTMSYNMEGKTVLITGANSGIGKAAAIQLAQIGATVVMACRSSAARCTGIGRSLPGQPVRIVIVLSCCKSILLRKASVRRFSKNFMAKHARLDVLIHNAANFDHTLKKSRIDRATV
jgi:NAD(P)-dependent dehydrogenase (short-subunit alcohol dehydrogenase family)